MRNVTFLPTLQVQRTLSISPDCTQVAYVDYASGQLDPLVLPIDGGQPRRLTSYTDRAVRRVASHPRW